MPRSALLCLKIEIWAVTDHLGLELECSRRKNRAAAKEFCNSPFFYALEKEYASMSGKNILKLILFG